MYADPHEEGVRLFLHYRDLPNGSSLRKSLRTAQSDDVYNLGAQSHVKVSFEEPEYTADIVAPGTLRLLEAVGEYQDQSGQVKFYQAGSSEMFGASPSPQSERTPFYPRSPYAVALYSYWQTVNYCEVYGIFACNGILFSHESERRGETFGIRKITQAATRIKLGLQEVLYLGNLDAKRDWGYAEAMWLMLQQDQPDDYVIATSGMHGVREFVERVFDRLGLNWRKYVRIDLRHFRPTEGEALCGDATKARTNLGWKPRVIFDELVARMVDHDLELARREKSLFDNGHIQALRAMAHV
jgi:GDPmannose 4,6-dehydratase